MELMQSGRQRERQGGRPSGRQRGQPLLTIQTYRARMQVMLIALVCSLALSTSAVLPPAVFAQDLLSGLLSGVETMLGESVAASVREEYGEPARLPRAQRHWVDTIFADISAQATRSDVTYTLEVLESDVVNAFAAPGGYLFITTGLLRHIDDDTDALANVLGHEVAHVERKHAMNTLGRQLGVGVLLQLVFGGSSDSVQTIAAAATELMRLGWSRDQEHEADDVGQRLAAQAGYDPAGMVRFFEVLRKLEGQEIPFLEFLRTHPLTSDRIERARLRAKTLQIAPRAKPKPSAR